MANLQLLLSTTLVAMMMIYSMHQLFNIILLVQQLLLTVQYHDSESRSNIESLYVMLFKYKCGFCYQGLLIDVPSNICSFNSCSLLALTLCRLPICNSHHSPRYTAAILSSIRCCIICITFIDDRDVVVGRVVIVSV